MNTCPGTKYIMKLKTIPMESINLLLKKFFYEAHGSPWLGIHG